MPESYCGKTAGAIIRDILESYGIDWSDWSQPYATEQDEWASVTPMGIFVFVDGSVEYLEEGK